MSHKNGKTNDTSFRSSFSHEQESIQHIFLSMLVITGNTYKWFSELWYPHHFSPPENHLEKYGTCRNLLGLNSPTSDQNRTCVCVAITNHA